MPLKSLILNWAAVDETTTDLFIYDEIAHEKSFDWAKGERGPEVTAREVMDKLEEITTPNIVVRINSGGGDVTEAVAIAQALRDARNRGREISCQIDGLCASAAVNVALACKPIRIPRNAYMMIHDPANVLVGIFTSQEMRRKADALDTVKRGIVSGYAQRTGLADREIIRMMAAETWMTGEEAVAAHFADELLEDPVTIQRDTTTQNLLLNGRMVNSAAFDTLPDPLKAAQIQNSTKEEKTVEIKTVEDLKNAYPELCSELEKNARKEGRKEERERLQAIDEVANAVSPEMINSAKYQEPIDAKELLFRAAKDGQLVNRSGASVLAAMAQDAQVVNTVGGFANNGVTPGMTAEQMKQHEAESAAAKAFKALNLKK